MPDQPDHIPRHTALPAYATNQLNQALAKAATLGDAVQRARALAKAVRWRDVLAGMADGRLDIGSRIPVTDTPAWVTLDVAHGGFASGRYLAETPLTRDETARLAALPEGVPGVSDRERLNLWYLGDAGQAELLDALRRGHYRVDLPEHAALAVAVALLDKGFPEQALDLVAELRPLMHRLRFTPALEPVARLSGAAVRVASVAEVAESLRAVRVPRQLAAMRETLRVWHPLYDRLIALWCDTVDGELPFLDETSVVRGGWPCRRWPADWASERAQWLADYAAAANGREPPGRHGHPRSNFIRLRDALLVCPQDSAALSARQVGWIRRALANTLTRHGQPGSPRRDAERAAHTAIATAPTHAALAEVLAQRLDRYPADAGLPSLDPIAIGVSTQDTMVDGVPLGTPIPKHLLAKAARALEAPMDELVGRGVITSGEVLAIVLPQLTSRLIAAGIDDPMLAGLYEHSYTAFRRRRGLLLLNLEHQVRFDELPWVAALAPCRSPQPNDAVAAFRSLQQTSLLALTAFPHALLPNPLVRELGTLAKQARVELPLVEEVAADIFMGTFTAKWRDAAMVASRTMAGTLYADYYDLPLESRWTTRSRSIVRWGKTTAVDFAELCAERATEAGETGSHVARNGAVLEQSQILTTHNLAVLVQGVGLADGLRERAPTLAWQTLRWVVRRLAQRPPNWHAALIQVKNAAYAWRQAIFLLSFCQPSQQASLVRRLGEEVRSAGIDIRFSPGVDGLAHVIAGGRFTATGLVSDGEGRRFLGWAAGQHWYLAPGATDQPG